MHAWNPAQPNPQPCPTTHASPQLITQDVLGRAKKVLKTGQALSSTPAPAAQPMSIDVDGLRNSLRSELKAGALASAAMLAQAKSLSVGETPAIVLADISGALARVQEAGSPIPPQDFFFAPPWWGGRRKMAELAPNYPT